MSERNIEILRQWFEVFNARDIGAMIGLCEPGVEFHSAFAAVGGAIYHGHDGIRRWHRDLQEAWGANIRLEPKAFFDLGACTLAFFVYAGRGRHSGAEVAMQATAAVRWSDGLMTYAHVYLHRADALRDLGVSEDELERIEP
jgi:ketosteroid isomerase-like protein